MNAHKIYRVEINDLENVFRLSATPLPSFEGVYLLCNHQRPNNTPKKIAIEFTDNEGVGYDVFDYEKDLEYVNIPGQYPTSIGPALIKNIEIIFTDVLDMVKVSKHLH